MFLTFYNICPEEVSLCYSIESSSYHKDEAASYDTLMYRQLNAKKYFRCLHLNQNEEKKLIGFICSTRCNEFIKESIYSHNPSGKILAIHSVVVDNNYRRKGYARSMLLEYINYVKSHAELDGLCKIKLMAKHCLTEFYVSCGFIFNGSSAIQHGKDQWYEFEYSLQ